MTKIGFKVIGRRAFLINEKHSQTIRDAFSFAAPGAYFSPAHKLYIQTRGEEGWDGRTSFFKDNSVYVGLLLGAREELKKQGIRVVIKKWRKRPEVELRKGYLEKDPKYAYQRHATRAMLECLTRGGGVVLAATGAGKTKTSADFFSNVKGKVIFVVDQIDLLYQSQKEIQEWLDRHGTKALNGKGKARVGVVGNGKFDPGDLTVATIQTLSAQKRKKKFREWCRDIAVIIVDEMHVQMGRRNYSIIQSINPQAVMGLTATLQMRKKEVRYKVFTHAGPVVYEFPIQKGVKAGVLTKAVAIQNFYASNPKERQDIKYWKTDKRTGEKQRAIREAVAHEHNTLHNINLRKRLGYIVDIAMEKGYATMVLVNRVKHVKLVAKDLAVYKPKLAYGGIDKTTRRKTYKNFDEGKHNLIIGNRVVTKGINIKRIDLIVDVSEEHSKNNVLQKLGRGVRLYKGKIGLIFISLNSLTREGQKAAANQKSAFRSAKIPCITPDIEGLAEVKIAKRLLKEGKKKLNSL